MGRLIISYIPLEQLELSLHYLLRPTCPDTKDFLR